MQKKIQFLKCEGKKKPPKIQFKGGCQIVSVEFPVTTLLL